METWCELQGYVHSPYILSRVSSGQVPRGLLQDSRGSGDIDKRDVSAPRCTVDKEYKKDA